MNENIDLTKILKGCPIGTKLYLTLCGEVKLIKVENDTYPICVENINGDRFWLTQDGKHISGLDGECILFPSKEQRDWSKFTPEWDKEKKERFNPKTLKPFDKVLARRGNENYNVWFPDFISDPPNSTNNKTLCMCVMEDIAMVIPYNDDTKHLVGTTDEAPEYYRYWED